MKLKSMLVLFNLLPGFLCANQGFDDYQMGKFKEASRLLQDNHPYSQRYLGEMYLYGYGVPRNSQKALEYYQNAASQGDIIAQQIMARYVLSMEKNPEGALDWFKKAALQGDVDAMFYCAAAYQLGFGVQKSPDLVTHYTIEAAKRGHARAQYNLARHFFATGDKRMGELWFEKAFKQGDVKALVWEAKRLHQQKEYAKAQDILAPALQKNAAMAYALQADWFFEKNDLAHAHTYLLKAAKKAYPKAQLALGQFYLQKNTPYYHPDYGFSWILHAAQLGDESACTYLKNQTWSSAEMAKIDTLENLDRKIMAYQQLAQWITAYEENHLQNTTYRLKGIWHDWQNKDALEEGRQNAYPKFFQLSVKELFKPHLVLVKPKDLSVQTYIEAIMALQKPIQPFDGEYPSYLENLPEKISLSLEQQASLGVATAQFQLAACYQFGRGVEKNLDKARLWYTRALAQDFLPAEYQLAMMDIQTRQHDLVLQGQQYLRDAALKGDTYAAFTLGLMQETQNPREALNMLMIAAVNGYPKAQYRLAQHLSRESMTALTTFEKSVRHALLTELYKKAFQKGIQEAALPLAFYESESKIEKNRQWAMKTALSFATRGYAEAALLVGLMLQKDAKEDRFEHAAKQWFQQAKSHPIGAFVWSFYAHDDDEKQSFLQSAAQVDFAPAILNLAILKYLDKQSPIALLEKAQALNDLCAKHLLVNFWVLEDKPETLAKAREMLSQMAEQNDAQAQWKLGYLSVNGLGGQKNIESGLAYLEKAAEKEPTAQLVLAYLYHLGRLTELPDEQKAKYWFAKAAEVIPKASIALGYIYEMIDKNYPMALLAYERVREQESVLANYNIALIYEYGKGIEPNYFKATRYFILAAESGSAAAMFKLSHVYQNRGYTLTAKDYLHQAALRGYRPAVAALSL